MSKYLIEELTAFPYSNVIFFIILGIFLIFTIKEKISNGCLKIIGYITTTVFCLYYGINPCIIRHNKKEEIRVNGKLTYLEQTEGVISEFSPQSGKISSGWICSFEYDGRIYFTRGHPNYKIFPRDSIYIGKKFPVFFSKRSPKSGVVDYYYQIK
jgi:hypothetical protein